MSATRSEFPYPMRPYDVLPTAEPTLPIPPEATVIPVFGKSSQETYIVCNYVGHDGVRMEYDYGDAPTSWEELDPTQRPFYTRDASRSAHPTITRAGLYKIQFQEIEHSIAPTDDGFSLILSLISRTSDDGPNPGAFESLVNMKGQKLVADEFGIRTKVTYTIVDQNQLDYQDSVGILPNPGHQYLVAPSDNIVGLNVGDTFVPYFDWLAITADPFEAKVTFSITPVLWFEESA